MHFHVDELKDKKNIKNFSKSTIATIKKNTVTKTFQNGYITQNL